MKKYIMPSISVLEVHTKDIVTVSAQESGNAKEILWSEFGFNDGFIG